MSATEILEQFRRLPIEEKRRLAELMRDEIEEGLTPEQIAKFEERAERLRHHPETGVRWETIRAELKGRLEKSRECRGK